MHHMHMENNRTIHQLGTWKKGLQASIYSKKFDESWN